MWSRKQLFLVPFIIIITSSFLLVTYWTNWKEFKSQEYKSQIFEFNEIDENLSKNNQNIFFVETSCFSNSTERPLLNPRQACAIYSAAVKNPKHSVFLLHSCFLPKQTSTGFVEKILDLPNVSIKWINITKIFNDSIIIKPILDKLSTSKYSIEHASDILSFYLLYEYGGTYMDLDVVSLKPLDQLGHNYVGAQQKDQIGIGIIHFEYDGKGHNLMEKTLKKIARDYDPESWAGSGPVLLGKVITRFCHRIYISDWTTVGKLALCGITVHPYYYFYPISWIDWEKYYDENNTQVLNELNDTYVVHVWNHMGKTKIKVGSNQPYGRIAQNYCGPIYWRSGEYF